MEMFYKSLADVVLLLHVVIVLFNLVGLLLIWIGWLRRWGFVRNVSFRIAHLLCMGYVAVQAVFGMTCPLTTWENALRTKAGTGPVYEESFIGHWFGKLLFYEAEPWVFTVGYIVFFGLIVLSWIIVPPRQRIK